MSVGISFSNCRTSLYYINLEKHLVEEGDVDL